MTNKKKYTLKPGKHQFAPGSAATHHNDNLSDAEAEWYIEKYPHIKDLFEINSTESESLESTNQSVQSNLKSVESINQSVQSQPQSVQSKINNENLSATN